MQKLTPEPEKESFLQSFLLGRLVSAVEIVHHHLIQGENNEALSAMNKAMRYINEEVNKFYYKPTEEDSSCDPKPT